MPVMAEEVSNCAPASTPNCLMWTRDKNDTLQKPLTAEVLDILLDSAITHYHLDRYRNLGIQEGMDLLPRVRFNATDLFFGLEIETKKYPREIYSHIEKRIKSKLRRNPEDIIVMAYITPTNALCLVVRHTQGYTLEDERQAWEHFLGMPCNPSCESLDYSYLITCRTDLLYYNPQVLFDAQSTALSSSPLAEAEEAEISQTPPSLPLELPESIRTIISCTPENCRAAVAQSCFAALRIFLKDCTFRYADNTVQEPCFLSLTLAPHASGKSSIRPPLKAILYDVEQQDQLSRAKEMEWREICSTLPSNKEKPKKPKDPIKLIDPNCTMPALLELSVRAQGASLYTYCEEMEKALMLSNFSTLCRTSYDCEMLAAERVSAQAVSASVPLRWSFCLASTPTTARQVLRHDINNGTLSRLTLSTIEADPDEWSENYFPIHGDYNEDYREAIKPYTSRLAQTKGVIECKEAISWVMKEKATQIARLKAQGAKHMLPFLWRALQMGFWRFQMLHIMEQGEGTTQIENFCSFSVSYDLWCKERFFGDMIAKMYENEPTQQQAVKKTSPLALLPEEFTREDARQARILMGMADTSRGLTNLLAQWTHRGQVIFDEEKKFYRKVTTAQAIHHQTHTIS